MTHLAPLLALLARPALAVTPPAEVPTEAPDTSALSDVRDRLRSLKDQGEPLKAPPWKVLGFEDLPGSGDCEALAARYGQCVEQVRFVSVEALYTPGDAGARDVASAISHLALNLWEELASRWDQEGDLPQRTLVKDGFGTLPTPAESWDVARVDTRRRAALPARDHWMDEGVWVGPESIFRPARAVGPSAAPTPPPMVVLTGRFALRMGYDGRSYDYDLMDADPGASAPFFEQMFPFSKGATAAVRAPLEELTWPAVQKATALSSDTYAAFVARAERSFEDFERVVGITIAQYALEEFTPNQMRVLSALSLMRSPPGDGGTTGGRTSDLVAAALGQTDDAEAAQAAAQRQQLAFEKGFRLRYSQLPSSVVEPWLSQLVATPEAQNVAAIWNSRVRAVLGDLLRAGAPEAGGLDGASIDAWLDRALIPGQDVAALGLEARRVALSVLVEAQPTAERNRVESWIFLDHVNDELAGGLDPTGARIATPAELVQVGTDAWTSTIKLHGRATFPLSQALGGVDPTSVCTTLDGRAAQAEPSIKPVELSELVVGPRGLKPDEVIWQGRAQLAVLAVDRPSGVRWSVEPVVDLPDGLALYRVSWRVWSGWHLLWSAEARPDGGLRLAAHTAAICEDMVLSPPELVATVVRAAVLEGAMRGPVPPARAEEAPEGPPPEVSPLLQGLGRAPLLDRAAEGGGLLVMVFDLDRSHAGRVPPWRTPYVTRVRRLGGGDRLRATGWGLYLNADSKNEPVFAIPASPAATRTSAESARPLWRPARVPGWTLGGGLALIPLRATGFTCEVSPTDTDVVGPCPDDVGRLLSSGLGVDLSAAYTIWMGPQPRFAVSAGPALRLDVQIPGAPWLEDLGDEATVAWPVGAGPDYDWTLRPAAGLSLGVRLQPAPAGLVRRGQPWGAEGASGRSRVGRSALGVQTELMTGPGYNGLEWTAAAELWAARSIDVGRTSRENLRPYRPTLWVGPYARGQMGFLIGQPEVERYLELTTSQSVMVGARAWLRLAGEPPAPPELP